MAKNVLVLKHFELPKEAGVYYRLVCLTGANKGESYVLVGNRIVIGRSDKADIRLSDTKASREHAEVTKVGENWFATDLGSQNGIMVNENKVTQIQLNESDKLIIGQTVLKFARVEVSSKNRVIKEQTNEEANGSKKTLIPIILMAGIFIYLILDTETPKQAVKPIQPRAQFDVTSELTQLKKRQAVESKAMSEKLNVIFHKGLREYREGNYLRAIEEFQMALIMAPSDSQAEYYLRKSKEELDSSIDGFTARAQWDEGALKYKSAIVSYCSIIRLLYRVPEDPRYKNAEKQIGELEGKLGMETGETECLKKPRTDS